MKLSDRRSWLAGALAMAVVAAGASVATSAQAAVTGCQVAYQVSSQWSGGFSANVSLTNLGDPVTSWQLTWSFTAGQTVTQLWNGSVTQSGAQVTVTNAAWNGAIGTGGTASLGFNGSSGATNPVPTDFALNGVPCTGGTSGGGPTTTPPTTTPSSGGGSLPSSFKWSSSGPLIVPKSDANHNLVAVKDASVVRFNGKWHAFLSTVNTAG
ncbi:MAG TPA: cellulose binding domain-containing protein, partial [Pseudonocardiaceae bacterium]